MSNKSKKSKNAARKMEVQARSISARAELKKVEAYLQWDGLTQEQKQKLSKGGIWNVETYQAVVSSVRPPKGVEMIEWIGAFGLGIVDTVGDFMGILNVRHAEQRLKDFNNLMAGAVVDTKDSDLLALGDRKIQNAYRTLPLADGRAYLASPYDFDTSEGRIWLDAALRSPGLAAGQQVTYHLAA